MGRSKYICTHCKYQFEGEEKEPLCAPGNCPRCRYGGVERQDDLPDKARLKQYLHLKRELSQLQEKLALLRARGEQDEALYELAENQRLRCLALLLQTQQYIYSIDDSLLRQIFELRYVKGLKWAGVAAALGGYYSEDYVRILHDRYLRRH